ncbi:MAG TPA: serine hydrolase [Variovorax sp.]|nr:serine hydrolase [Variovorax sp.]
MRERHIPTSGRRAGNRWRGSSLALACALALGGQAASAQPMPAAPAGAPPSSVPIAIQQVRWQMLNPGINALTFRTMDQFFDTREVTRRGAVWQIPRRDTSLDFRYEFGGVAYAPEDFLERTYTNALLVIKDGVIVYENYRNMSNDRTRFMAWSMTKSVVSTMVGIAVDEGRIALIEDPIVKYLPELKDGAYNGVTIRQVLEMRSGVDYEERYDFQNPGIAASNHMAALVRNTARFADAARTIQRAHPPGTHFAYKTIDTAVLGWLVERVSGTTFSAYMSEKLWEPLGAESSGYFVMDGGPGVGREFTGAGYNATARDFARIGLLFLNEGRANGRQIVSSRWVKAATTSATRDGGPNGGYGFQWWTFPDTGAYYALGLQGQFTYVDPATRTVVVKLSYMPPGGPPQPYDETRAFLRAASAWKPSR